MNTSRIIRLPDKSWSFMEELFQTVPETPEPIEAEVTGTIPVWLSGTLLRNGPGKYEFGKNAYKHWFDGLALLHGFFIDKGVVTYRSRYLRSNAYVKGEQQQRIAYAEFGTPQMPDPCQNIFARFFSYFSLPERTDNDQVNVFEMKGKVFLSSDSPIITEIQPTTLDLLDVANFKTDLTTPTRTVFSAAHSHSDLDGNVYYMTTSVGRTTRNNIIQVPPKTRANHIKNEKPLEAAQIAGTITPHNQSVYYHSFGLTPHYFVFVENPLVINSFEVLTMKVAQRSFHDCMHWDSKQPSRIYLVDRATKTCVAVHEVQSFFAFHHVNAYEDNGAVVVDICCYPDNSIIEQYYLHHLRSSKTNEVSLNFPDAEVRRYRLKIPRQGDLNGGETPAARVCYEILTNALELPRINFRLNGLPYRYVYGVGPRERGHYFDQLVKLDVATKERKTWYEEDCYPSEPVFVARPGSDSHHSDGEDDGVILSVVVGTRSRNSFLLVLEATTFEELARASVPAAARIPQSLHGNFFPSLGYNLESFHAQSRSIQLNEDENQDHTA